METHKANFRGSTRRPVWMPTKPGFRPPIHAISTGKQTWTAHISKTLPVASPLLARTPISALRRRSQLAIASTSTSAELEWEEAREPLHADIDTAKTCGVGLGMAFARAVLPRLEAPGVGVEVGLVPCAVGGMAIREWARGERLYDQMVQRARAATECGEIEAVLWYQGESEDMRRAGGVSP